MIAVTGAAKPAGSGSVPDAATTCQSTGLLCAQKKHAFQSTMNSFAPTLVWDR